MILLFLKKYPSEIIFNKTISRKKLLLLEYIFCILCFLLSAIYFKLNGYGIGNSLIDLLALVMSPILYFVCFLILFITPAKVITAPAGLLFLVTILTKRRKLIWAFSADLLFYFTGAFAFLGMAQMG